MGWRNDNSTNQSKTESKNNGKVHQTGKGKNEKSNCTLTTKHLKTLNNYNSLMAIIASLNFASIHRLKFTWALLPDNIMQANNCNHIILIVLDVQGN